MGLIAKCRQRWCFLSSDWKISKETFIRKRICQVFSAQWET